MSQRLSQIVDEIREISRDANDTFGRLSADQINWKPAVGSWSVGQCLDHLIRSNSQFYPEFKRLTAGTQKNSFWENYSPFTGVVGRFLIDSIKNDSRKFKAPSKAIVPPSDIEPDIVSRYVAHQDDLIESITATASVDWKNTILTSPFFRLITFTLDDAYTIFVEHARRHIRQARRVMENEGFPK